MSGLIALETGKRKTQIFRRNKTQVLFIFAPWKK